MVGECILSMNADLTVTDYLLASFLSPSLPPLSVLRTSLGAYNFNARGGSSHDIGGVTFTYTRGTSEELVARGPLATDTTIEVDKGLREDMREEVNL